MSSKSIELRRLMKQQKQTSKKINHPLAKYNNLEQIVCIICNTAIKNEIVWNAHLQSRKHKEKVTSIKTAKAQELRNAAFKHPLSMAVKDTKDEPVAKKQKTSLPSDFFDSSVSSSSGGKQQVESKQTDQVKTDESNKNSSGDSKLPDGFFDSSVVRSVSSKEEEESVEGKNDPSKTKERKSSLSNESLPEGFFDDPKKDAKARNVEYKDPQDEEWEKFQKMIQEETKVADTIRDEEDEESEMIRDMEEFNNMKSCLSRVETLKSLVHKNSKQKASKSNDIDMTSDDIENSSDEDIDGLFDWRAKMA